MSSSARLGRFAAWFGGLVLLGIFFVETDQGNITPLFGIFTGSRAQSKGTTAGSQPSGPPISAAGTERIPVDAPISSFPYVPPGG